MASAPRARVYCSKVRHAETYMDRVFSETLLSRLRPMRWTPVGVMPKMGASGRVCSGSWRTGRSGFCRAIVGLRIR